MILFSPADLQVAAALAFAAGAAAVGALARIAWLVVLPYREKQAFLRGRRASQREWQHEAVLLRADRDARARFHELLRHLEAQR